MGDSNSKLVSVSVLIMLTIWGFVALYHAGYIPKGLDLFIFGMIIVAGIYAFVKHMRRYKEEKRGFAVDDEMSKQIQYKAGYYSFIISIYIWLAIFLFHRFIPDIETMLGGGILLSAIVSMGIKTYITRSYNEDEN